VINIIMRHWSSADDSTNTSLSITRTAMRKFADDGAVYSASGRGGDCSLSALALAGIMTVAPADMKFGDKRDVDFGRS
jgi:hypothetical protein